MIKSILSFILVFALVSFAVDWYRSAGMTDTIPENHTQLSSLDLEVFDLITLSKETPVVVYFWATWCPVCRLVNPAVQAVSDTYPTIAVALASGDDNSLLHYAQQHDLTMPIVNDATQQIAREWGVSATPSIVIIANGQVVSVTTGVTSQPGLQARLLLAKRHL